MRRERSQHCDCSAIPANLLESELFGYEKGAFTDAKRQKRGLVELADEGTLFLDEISTLDLALQAKLLRFLETGTFKRVGGLRDIEVDLRVVAATNQDLEALSRQEKFRKDLFYRLNVCPVHLPTLAERKGDILPLARHFIALYNRKFGKSIQGLEPAAEALFLQYGWPGNVRELKNAIERAMIFEDADFISPRASISPRTSLMKTSSRLSRRVWRSPHSSPDFSIAPRATSASCFRGISTLTTPLLSYLTFSFVRLRR